MSSISCLIPKKYLFSTNPSVDSVGSGGFVKSNSQNDGPWNQPIRNLFPNSSQPNITQRGSQDHLFAKPNPVNLSPSCSLSQEKPSVELNEVMFTLLKDVVEKTENLTFVVSKLSVEMKTDQDKVSSKLNISLEKDLNKILDKVTGYFQKALTDAVTMFKSEIVNCRKSFTDEAKIRDAQDFTELKNLIRNLESKKSPLRPSRTKEFEDLRNTLQRDIREILNLAKGLAAETAANRKRVLDVKKPVKTTKTLTKPPAKISYAATTDDVLELNLRSRAIKRVEGKGKPKKPGAKTGLRGRPGLFPAKSPRSKRPVLKEVPVLEGPEVVRNDLFDMDSGDEFLFCTEAFSQMSLSFCPRRRTGPQETESCNNRGCF